MSADLSNSRSGYRLPRRSILRGKDSFELIFRKGIRLAGTHADLRYVSYPNPAGGLKVAFIAGRRLGNAVQRNHGKRLLREAYRLQQHFLDPVDEQNDTYVHLAFILKSSRSSYHQIFTDVGNLLERLRSHINNSQENS
ncbi:MAG: ribonuclease P protein component [Bacteroidetes bacterium]|nr:ribonuclease P protein component [Bacteroidota bacterium]MCH8524814.1 ribonuclease P protein component [Balneolales bacterium]